MTDRLTDHQIETASRRANTARTPEADAVRRHSRRAAKATAVRDRAIGARDEAIIAMRATGASFRDIGAEAGISHTAVKNIWTALTEGRTAGRPGRPKKDADAPTE